MAEYTLSSYSNPAHSLTGFTGVSIASGSDIAVCIPYITPEYILYPAGALGTSMSLQAGSDIAATSPYAPTDGTGIDGTKASLKPTGGGTTVPTTGQIFPLGTQ